MSKQPVLTLAYLEQAPESAAGVLQTLGTDDAVAFLETMPARLTAPVLNRMIPWQAARCLEQMSAAQAAGILRQLAFHDRSSLLRLVRADSHDALLEELPERQARRLRNALQYPVSQIGGWAEPEVPILRTDSTVADAMRVLRETRLVTPHVFVETSEGQFAGALTVQKLLGAELSWPLSALAIAAVEPLFSRGSLAMVAFDQRWDEFTFLPVVGRRGTIIGGLSRRALHEGVDEQRQRAQVRSKSALGYTLEALSATCTGLLRLLGPAGGQNHGQ